MPDRPKPYYPFPLRKKAKPTKTKHKLSRQERGYDNNWEKLRNWWIAKEPLCQMCLHNGHVTVAKDVDHIQPFRDLEDPLRLDPENLQSLCRPCHNHKTRRHD